MFNMNGDTTPPDEFSDTLERRHKKDTLESLKQSLKSAGDTAQSDDVFNDTSETCNEKQEEEEEEEKEE